MSVVIFCLPVRAFFHGLLHCCCQAAGDPSLTLTEEFLEVCFHLFFLRERMWSKYQHLWKRTCYRLCSSFPWFFVPDCTWKSSTWFKVIARVHQQGVHFAQYQNILLSSWEFPHELGQGPLYSCRSFFKAISSSYWVIPVQCVWICWLINMYSIDHPSTTVSLAWTNMFDHGLMNRVFDLLRNVSCSLTFPHSFFLISSSVPSGNVLMTPLNGSLSPSFLKRMNTKKCLHSEGLTTFLFQ